MSKRPKIITRKVALKRGLTRYFTGKPCKRGHISERKTCDWTCLMCKRLQKAEYDRTPKGRERMWRANHSPKGRERTWRFTHSPKGRETARRANHSPKGRERTWRSNHSPKGRERKWRFAHSPKRREYKREYCRTPEYRTKRNVRRRERRLDRLEAEYKADTTQANYNRWMNLIARRRRDGR
jgi:hypothetical protein